MLRTLLIITIVLLAGCSNAGNVISSNVYPEVIGSDLERWEKLIGKWHGKQSTASGGEHEWLVDRMSDGTYTIQFKFKDESGSTKYKTEIGRWGNSGNVYFSTYRGDLEDGKVHPSSPSDPSIYDAYYIITLTDNEFEYRHARTNDQFVVIKVPNDFSLLE